jgi:hypothetical protein
MVWLPPKKAREKTSSLSIMGCSLISLILASARFTSRKMLLYNREHGGVRIEPTSGVIL